MDWIATFSSLEHSGLGRYGDALDPDGDRKAMQQAWCALKPGGIMLFGGPMTCAADGYIEFNLHRVYGYRRIAYIAQGFELVGFLGGSCPPHNMYDSGWQWLVLLRKPADGSEAPIIALTDLERAAAAHSD